MTPKTMQAIKIVSAGKAEVQTAPVPKLRDHYILVKNTAVAINPTDWKHIDYHPTTGATVGCDFVGTVVALGPKVTKDYKVGDRIAGVNHGSNQTESEDGAFGEYCVVKEGLTFKVPEQMSDEQAATVGVAVTTIASGLYDKLGMPMPGSGKNGEGQWLLVYGGSTAMGSLAVQSAVLSGYKVVATCSPRNFDFVKSLGAEAVFDYNDSDCSKKMNEHTGDKLSLVFDCVAEGDSTKICMAALSSDGGKIAALLPVSQENSRTNVTNEFVNAYTCIGEAYTKFGKYNEANPKVYESCSQFWEVAGKLFAEGKLVAHPQKVNLEGEGLEGVLKGLQIMRDGKVSGFKLVYRIDGPK